AAGVLDRAVLAGVELGVVLVRKRRELAALNGANENAEGLQQHLALLVQVERELRFLADDERLDRRADVLRIGLEEARHRHRVERELQTHTAIDLVAEVHVAERLTRLVVDDAETIRTDIDAVDRSLDAHRNAVRVDDERFGMIGELAMLS